MDNRSLTIQQLKNEIDHENREIARMRERREEIAARPLRDERRRRRFLQRLDAEIKKAEDLKAMAEANLAGLGDGHV